MSRLRLFVPWLLLGLFLTLPTSLQPWELLLGDPRIDVWNHAWGYWFVADALSRGELPWYSPLVGAPDGGVLYFIDTPGAVAWAPVTLLLGPAVAYNLALIVRIALSGLGARLLSEELSRPGPHNAVAGIAYAATPFLLGELGNGISEVCTVHWPVLALWALARALRSRSWGHWAWAGLLFGLSGVASFYYGLATGLMVGPALLAYLLVRRDLRALGHGLLCGGLALGLILPIWAVFRASLADSNAIIRRSAGLNEALAAHNAVDPRAYIMPGDFSSVDFAAQYGESFVHSSYLRWSVLLLAGYALIREPRLRSWAALMALSLICGLGSMLWWGGDWVRMDGRPLTLPFGWLLELLPEVAITHPARLQVGALVISSALAGVGLGRLLEGRARQQQLAALAGLLVLAESLWGSAAVWPIPRSSAHVPDFYAQAPQGMVLDLPSEVGMTMQSSQYFWFQTVHGQPLPWTPDVRLGSARDRALMFGLGRPAGPILSESPGPLNPGFVQHLYQNYGMVVLHPELELAAQRPSWMPWLSRAFGPPLEVDGRYVWYLRPPQPSAGGGP